MNTRVNQKKLIRSVRIASLSVLSTMVGLAGCAPSPPTIANLEILPRPNLSVPLVAWASFETDRPTMVEFEIDDGVETRSFDARVPPNTTHEVPLLGLKPGRTHRIRVTATDADGARTTSEPFEVTTDPLPDDFPPLDVRVSRPDRMEPGYTLVEAAFSGDGVGQDTHYLMALDASGDVVWYYAAPHAIGDAQRIANGHFLYRTGNTHIYEIDILGNVVAHWASALAADDEVTDGTVRVATDTLHHEAFEMPSGNLMALSTEVRSFEDYPTSDTDPEAPRATSNVVGDVITEFTRDGQIVRQIRLLDLFDPYRIGYGSLGGFWLGTYSGRAEVVRDWSHANGISLDATGRYLLVSMRHQGAVAKIDLESESVVWILGAHGGWRADWEGLLLEPQGELLWQADQHAPMYTPSGTVLMFDNGTNRAVPFEPRMPAAESFSRAVEYEVDEENQTVREVWSYGGPGEGRHYAWRVGDADWMPETGNVLITYGGMSDDEDGNTLGGNGHNWVRIVEVTHDSPAEEVFEVVIDDERPRGWLSFQAERIPTLYP